MNAYILEPQDLLFFRDGRPIATAGGHGARWPEPSVIFDALHAALHRAFPEPQAWEHAHRFGRSSRRSLEGDRSQRFGSLATAGLFPVGSDGCWLFPAPADALLTSKTDDTNWLLLPVPASGKTNLPAPFLKCVAGSFAPPTKETAAPWWTAAAWAAYLSGKRPDRTELFTNDELFAGEWTTGIGIDPETQTQDGQRIYSAEYLRLRPDVRCGFLAALPMKQNGTDSRRETMGHLFAATNTIIVGGQQRPCRVEELKTPANTLLPVGRSAGFSSDCCKYRVKWTLLSPAVWPKITANPLKGLRQHPGGWLPNWVCAETGAVLLRHRTGPVRRVWDDARKRTVRQAETETDIPAHLVGACVPKALPVTGWTERLHLLQHEGHWSAGGSDRGHGPRSTHLAVPAGAVYYFEADSAEAAVDLAAALNWHGAEHSELPTPHSALVRNRRSTLLGEKGFGLGVCGPWDFFPGGGRA
jgi:hypothetical protein